MYNVQNPKQNRHIKLNNIETMIDEQTAVTQECMNITDKYLIKIENLHVNVCWENAFGNRLQTRISPLKCWFRILAPPCGDEP